MKKKDGKSDEHHKEENKLISEMKEHLKPIDKLLSDWHIAKENELINLKKAYHDNCSIETISSLLVEKCMFDLKSVHNVLSINHAKRTQDETYILIIVAYRLAIQFSGFIEKHVRHRIIELFHFEISSILRTDDTLLNQRGRQYLNLIDSCKEPTSSKEWSDLIQSIGMEFEQFCLGAGKEVDPLVINDIFDSVFYWKLAGEIWLTSHAETVKLLHSFRHVLNKDTTSSSTGA